MKHFAIASLCSLVLFAVAPSDVLADNGADTLAQSASRCFVVSGNVSGRVTVKVRLDKTGSVVGEPVATGDGDRPSLQVLIPAAVKAIKTCAPYQTAGLEFPEPVTDVLVSFTVGDPPPAAGSIVDTFRVEASELRMAVPDGYCRVKPESGDFEKEYTGNIETLLGERLLVLGFYLPCAFIADGMREGEDSPGWFVAFAEKRSDGTVWRDINLPLEEMIAKQAALIPSVKKSPGFKSMIAGRFEKTFRELQLQPVEIVLSDNPFVWVTPFAACTFEISQAGSDASKTIQSAACHTLAEGYRVSVAAYTPLESEEAISVLHESTRKAVEALVIQSTPAQ